MNAAWKAGNVECVAIADADTAHLDEAAAACRVSGHTEGWRRSLQVKPLARVLEGGT